MTVNELHMQVAVAMGTAKAKQRLKLDGKQLPMAGRGASEAASYGLRHRSTLVLSTKSGAQQAAHARRTR